MSDFQSITEADGRVKTTNALPAEINYFRGFAMNGDDFIVKEWNGVETIYFNGGVAVNSVGVILINSSAPVDPNPSDNGYEVDDNGLLYASDTGTIDAINQAVGFETGTVGGVLQVTVGGATALPADPTNLVATADGAALCISLTWDDNANNESGYRVERSIDAPGAWATADTLPAGATSYDDICVSGNEVWFYRVFAFNGVGDSSPSNEDSATVGNFGFLRVTRSGAYRATRAGNLRQTRP